MAAGVRVAPARGWLAARSGGRGILRLGRMLVLLFLGWGGGWLVAQDARPGPAEWERMNREWVFRQWTIEDGLPDDVVLQVREDSTGALLLGTREGLARYNGTEFILSGLVPQPNRRTGRLGVDREGRIWVGSSIEIRWSKPPGLSEELRKRLAASGRFAVAENGDVWAFSPTMAAYFGPAGWKIWDLPVSGRSSEYRLIATQPGGERVAWIDADHQLHRRTTVGADDPPLALPPIESNGFWVAMEWDWQGGLWLGSSDGRVYRLERDQWVEERVEGVPSRVESISRQRDRRLVFSFGGVLMERTTAGQWAPVLTLGHPAIQHALLDETGAWWLGLEGGGLARAAPRVATLYATSSMVNAVEADASGRLIAAVRDHGAKRLDEGSGTWAMLAPLDSVYYTNAVVARGEDVWVANSRGLLRLLGRQHEWVQEVGPANSVVRLLAGAEGTVWVAHADGVLHQLLPGGKPAAGAVSLGAYPHALAAGQNELWAATEKGLLVVRDGKVEPAGPTVWRGLPVYSVSVDRRGRALCSLGEFGMAVVDQDRHWRLSQNHGLTVKARSVDMAPNGDVWVGARDRVLKIPFDRFEAVLAGQAVDLRPVTYGPEDGVRAASVTRGSRAVFLPGRPARVAFATTGGALVLPQEKPLVPGGLPQGRITHIELADGTGIPRSQEKELRLPALTRTMTIHWEVLMIERRTPSAVRYRVLPFDAEWSSPQGAGSAIVTGLKPGSYTFELELRDQKGEWRPGDRVALEVVPAWWERRWFQVMLLSGSLGALVFATKRWADLQHAAAEATLNERSRIAGYLHDDIGNRLNELQLIVERTTLLSPTTPATALAEEIRDRVVETSAALNEVVWVLDNQQQSWSGFLGRLESRAQRYLRTAGVVLTTRREVAESLAAEPVPIGLHEALLFTVQELLHNAVAHAEARQVELVIEVVAGKVRLRVADDGRGFAPVVGLACERGLRRLQNRALQLGGLFKVTSKAGSGTVCDFEFPLHGTALESPA